MTNNRHGAKSRAWLAFVITVMFIPAWGTVAGAGEQSPEPPRGKALAWMRFDDGPEDYKGTHYWWLGKYEMKMAFQMPPKDGHALDLLWGSKNDTRTAEITVNGKTLKTEHGGYDGFRWLRIDLPDSLKGDAYEVTFKKTGPKEAFLAAARLTDVTIDASQPERMDEVSHRASLETESIRTEPVRLPEVYPAMEEMWNSPAPLPGNAPDKAHLRNRFAHAEANGRLANEMFFRCRRFVDGWLEQADPETGLIPRNLSRSRDIWNARDSAADNYPFMVLTCALTDRDMFRGRMRDMLRTEIKLTSRIDRLPDTYSFSKDGFRSENPKLDSIIFGGSEYVKDGLMPLTEWLGHSPWSERMLGIVDDIWKHAPVDTEYGKIPSTNVEVNGEMLQVLSRLYWMTGEEKYLKWAERLGDYYLLGDHHPTRDMTNLRLRDHGCEIISGLSELYAAVSHAHSEKKEAYREPVHGMFDRVLEVARDPRGMLYNTINPQTGDHSKGFCDTWGYNYNGIYTVYLLDDTTRYRTAVRAVLGNLPELKEYHWGSADEYADSIEGAINLYNREPVDPAAEWIDSEIHDMWSGQRASGVIEGWHGDGNVARTAIMYALWKTRGITARPWRKDLRFGVAQQDGTLYISLFAEKPWQGRLIFDKPRHSINMHLPLDYPRINQFPEWFTAEAGESYTVRDVIEGTQEKASGEELQEGLEVDLEGGRQKWLIVE